MDRAFAEFRRIDVVVSNAGYRLFGAARGLDDGDIEHSFLQIFSGAMQVVHVALPHVRAQ